MKLNGTHQILVNADGIILGESVHTVKKNTEASVAASKESGLDVNADKTTYRVMSRDQNAGRSHNTRVKTDNSSLKGRNSSNILEQPYQIKILFRKKLRAY